MYDDDKCKTKVLAAKPQSSRGIPTQPNQESYDLIEEKINDTKTNKAVGLINDLVKPTRISVDEITVQLVAVVCLFVVLSLVGIISKRCSRSSAKFNHF